MGLQTLGALALLLLLAISVEGKAVKGAVSKKSAKSDQAEVPLAVVNNQTVSESNRHDNTANNKVVKVPLVIVNNKTVSESNKNDPGSGSGLSADEFEDDASGEGSAFAEDYNDRAQIGQGSGMAPQFGQYQQQKGQLQGPSVNQLLSGQSLGGFGSSPSYGMGMNQAPNPFAMQQSQGFQQSPMQYGQLQQVQPQQNAMTGAMPQYSQQAPFYSQSAQAPSTGGGCQPSCPSSCAPSCEETCCKTPPVSLPPSTKKIRWKERPRYQPGPPIPPPPLEPPPVFDLQCPSPCSQACAPSCMPSCCAANFPPSPQMYYPQQAAYPQAAYPQASYPQASYQQASYPQASYSQAAYQQPMAYPQPAYPPPPAYPPMAIYTRFQAYPLVSQGNSAPQSLPYGCSPSCQPQSCTQYCPSHCCATYT